MSLFFNVLIEKKRMRHPIWVLGLLVLLSLASCHKNESAYPGTEKVSFMEIQEQIANPERGFYTGTSFSSESASPITQSRLLSTRKEMRTLFMLEFWLKDFFESDISEGYLQLIRKSLEAYRGSGVKCILRFGYSDGIADLSHPDESGPFDPAEEVVLRHIAQLKPILQEYADVIYVLQAGFIGCWGEWYYTDHFVRNPISEADYQPRKHVCDALLDALPGNRQVELRTPRFKMKMYGYTLADTITLAESHQPTLKARLGGHNDCYLASANDQGTFNGPNERQYWNAETRYTIMGGETCGVSKYCACDNTLEDMAAQHFSYLNFSYDRKVISKWITEDCFEEIKARLGYRFVLTDGYFTQKPSSGGSFHVVLNIRNDGFASPMNPRDAEFVLTDKSGSVVKTYKISSDPRYWMPGATQVIDQNLDLPSGLSGEYSLSLNLPDPCETLRQSPLFSIRLANEGVWDENTGFNKLYSFTL